GENRGPCRRQCRRSNGTRRSSATTTGRRECSTRPVRLTGTADWRWSRQDPSHGAGGTEPVVDTDHREAGGAGGMHSEQGGDPLEGGTVSGGDGNGDDRGPSDTPDEAGQCSLHTGHDDDGIGVGQLVDR